MGEEIDRMMLLRKISIIFFIIFCLFVASVVIILVTMGSGDYGGSNSSFAVVDDYGEPVTKSINFEKSDALYFFSERYKSERTLFLDETPSLKIVNSDKYSIEITAPKGLADKLCVEMVEGCVVVSFNQEMYKNVKGESSTYKGLYVNCDVFDVTVYAPISSLYTSAELTLDYEAPVSDTMEIDVIGEIIEGSIHGINTKKLTCRVMGASTLELLGKVTETAHLEVWHNSKIHATELETFEVSTSVQTQIFGLSYISGDGYTAYNLSDMGTLITWGLVLALIATLFLTVFFRIKFVKQRKELDDFIDKVETEGNFLIKPEKNDENLLQNDE